VPDASVLVRGNTIEAVGHATALPSHADEVIDCRNKVVLPGLVNTHHHFFQTLTRAVPRRRTPISSAGCARSIRCGSA
jgi:cytosine/adenosine deaminase-related metal-dependent hydrolase